MTSRSFSVVLCLLLCAVLLTGGCSCSRKPGLAEMVDEHIEQSYLQKFQQQPGVSFLKRGGRYLDDGTKEAFDIERQHVIPMFEKLERELNLNFIALTSERDPESALAMVSRLPENVSSDDVMIFLKAAQKTFPGAILVERGHRWVSIDFLTPEEERLLE